MPTDVAHERVRATWDLHHERLWRAVLAWSGDEEVASDAVAEAFAQAIRRGEAIDHVDRWVWRSAFRIAAGALKGRPEPIGTDERADDDAIPDETVALLDALSRLNADDRTVVVLALVGGWSSAEIGRMTDTTAGAARVRLHRARARLRGLLEDDDG